MKQKTNLPAEILGWYGTIAILSAYALVSFSVIDPNTFIYQLLNATGAIGIVFISLIKKAYQPATLNIMWAIIGIVALVKLFV
jgi:hypothetical protein